MALERISINNFQSLQKIDLELGRFTVITGASSSGKSAFMRAIKALASGLRGNSAITVGAKSLAISAYTDKNVITLEKNKLKARYLVLDRLTDKVEPYSKLQRGVPEDVSKALRLQPITKENSSVNFAGQHDMPFLLKDSPSQVAKVLGDLTNVSTIFEAVRQANKKKLSVSSLLKTRQNDLDSLLEQAQQFKGLANRRAAVEAAESALERISQLDGRRVVLSQLVASVESSEAKLSAYSDLPEGISLDSLESLHSKYIDLRHKILMWIHASQQIEKFQQDFDRFDQEQKNLLHEVHSRLSELGSCPTCGREIFNEGESVDVK